MDIKGLANLASVAQTEQDAAKPMEPASAGGSQAAGGLAESPDTIEKYQADSGDSLTVPRFDYNSSKEMIGYSEVASEIHQTPHQEISYDYDEYGRRTQQTEVSAQDKALEGLQKEEVVMMEYNQLGQISSLEAQATIEGKDHDTTDIVKTQLSEIEYNQLGEVDSEIDLDYETGKRTELDTMRKMLANLLKPDKKDDDP